VIQAAQIQIQLAPNLLLFIFINRGKIIYEDFFHCYQTNVEKLENNRFLNNREKTQKMVNLYLGKNNRKYYLKMLHSS